MKRSQMMISFGAYDDDVYNFLQNEKNASAFIRMLVRNHMSGSSAPTQPNIVVNPPTSYEPYSEVKPVKEVVEQEIIPTKPKEDIKKRGSSMPDL